MGEKKEGDGLKIIFDRSSIYFILKAFGKTVDDEGYIVEDTKEQERVLTPEGDELRKEDLGVIASGSEIFIKNNFASLVNYVKERSGQK